MLEHVKPCECQGKDERHVSLDREREDLLCSFSAGKEYNWMIMKPTTAFTSLKSHQSFQGVNEDPKDPAPSFDSCNLNKFWYFL